MFGCKGMRSFRRYRKGIKTLGELVILVSEARSDTGQGYRDCEILRVVT